jgi:transcriptional regulator with XRE-family HTH domain
MPTTESTPGARLRAARLGAGLTQVQLADRLGVCQSRITDVERGRHAPSLNWLLRAAAALGIDPHELEPALASVKPDRDRT